MSTKEAEADKAQAFANLDATDDRDELTQILEVIARFAATGRNFTANEVRPQLPKGVNTYRIGRAFAEAIRLGWLDVLGFDEKSNKRNTHGKRINRYKGRVAA